MSATPTTTRRRARRAVLTLVAAAGLGLAVPAIASAHATLVSMDPADGSLLTSAPTQIVLTFDNPIQDLGDGVVVLDPSGNHVEQGAPTVVDRRVTEALKPITLPGHYSVAYRVTSNDGHPITQDLSFDYLVRGAPASGESKPSSSGSMLTFVVVAGVTLVGMVAAGVWLISRRDEEPDLSEQQRQAETTDA